MKKILTFISLVFLLACDGENSSGPIFFDLVNTSYFRDSVPNIELNKSGITPLVATVTLKSNVDGSASYRVLSDIDSLNYNGYAFNSELLAENNVEINVIGLYPGVKNKVEIKYINTETQKTAYDTLEIETAPLPDFFPEVSIKTKKHNNTIVTGRSLYLSTFVVGRGAGNVKTYPYAFDEYGNIRWYADLSEWGDLILPGEYTGDRSLIFGYANKIREISLAGEMKVDITVNDVNIHHDVIKLNGNYIAAVDVLDKTIKIEDGSEFNTVEDHIIEYSPTGAVIHEWDLTQILDIDRYDVIENNQDWFHMNAITYSDLDNSLIVSGRNQGVIKVDWENNLKWILAPHKGWGRSGPEGTGAETKPYLLTAVNSSGTPYQLNVQNGESRVGDFDWAWTQHDPQILPNGNLLVFDNGANRNYLNLDPTQSHSRIVEYNIDEDNGTVSQVFEYGKERGTELYSPIVSSVSYLRGNVNYLFSPGISDNWSKSQVLEINSSTGEVTFEAVSIFKNFEYDGSNAYGTFDLNYRTNKIWY